MSFNIVFCTMDSANNKIGKSVTDVITLTGTLKNETSIIAPTILINIKDEDITNHDFFSCNYCKISQFNRKYFITDIKSVRQNLIEVTCKCDVLDTYKDDILALDAIIRRQENSWNLYLDDGVFNVYQNPNIVTKSFPSGFSGQSILLAVAGS